MQFIALLLASMCQAALAQTTATYELNAPFSSTCATQYVDTCPTALTAFGATSTLDTCECDDTEGTADEGVLIDGGANWFSANGLTFEMNVPSLTDGFLQFDLTATPVDATGKVRVRVITYDASNNQINAEYWTYPMAASTIAAGRHSLTYDIQDSSVRKIKIQTGVALGDVFIYRMDAIYDSSTNFAYNMPSDEASCTEYCTDVCDDEEASTTCAPGQSFKCNGGVWKDGGCHCVRGCGRTDVDQPSVTSCGAL